MRWEEPGTTFSDIWYRVGPTRPRLSPHAQVTRQQYGPQLAYIIEDPAGGQYYRMSEAAHFFVGLLDGRRTVDEAWDACNAQLGDEAPTQKECIDVLSHLQLFGLLQGQMPLAADMVLERKAQAKATKVRRRTGKGTFFSIPIFNPEPMLNRLEYLCRAVFSRWGAAVWLIVALAGGYMVAANWRKLGSTFNTIIEFDPRNVILFSAVFLVLRILHELAHASACKAMGGRSTEIGIIMIAGILPLPYCDATSAWRFPETWRRVLVSAAGILVEIFIAAIAAIVWALTDPETAPIAHGLAYRTMLVAGITTIAFNLNPLLRYDGYYILSDLMGSPNLAQRSRELLIFVANRYIFGVRSLKPPRIRDRTEGWLMGVYAVLATPYRLFIGMTIALIISTKFVTLGLVLAVIVAIIWFVWPVLKGIGYLLGSPKLLGRRARAMGIVGGAVAALTILVGVVPFPAAGYAPAVVEPARKAPLRTGEQGFIAQILVGPDQFVHQGQPVLILENQELMAELAATRAQLKQARIHAGAAASRSPAEQEAAAQEVGQLAARVQRLERQADALTLRAPVSGRVIPDGGTFTDLTNLQGRFLQRGTLIGYMASTDDMIVRALVPDMERAYLFRSQDTPPKASFRVRGQAGRVLPASIIREQPVGTRELEHSALTTLAAGDIQVDPAARRDGRTFTALSTHWLVELRPDDPPERTLPGARARVRFQTDPQPLAAQLWRKTRQFLGGRLGR